MFKNMTPVLVRALSVFLLVLVVSAIFVASSYVYMDGARQDELDAKRAMRIWQSKINSSVEKNLIIDKFEANFIDLVNKGIVGEEARLSWFETIQNTTKRRGMPSVKYSVSTQTALDKNNLQKEYRGIDVFKSVMTLDVQMAHEGDLFALLNDLTKADGLFAVDRCEIQKFSNVITNTGNNMKAYCELGWYTFRDAKASGGK